MIVPLKQGLQGQAADAGGGTGCRDCTCPLVPSVRELLHLKRGAMGCSA